MHFSPVTIGITAFFILSRFAAASESSDHVDDAVPFSRSGQLKPAHLRLAPHHRYEDGENSFGPHHHRHRLLDDHYPHPSKGLTGTGSTATQEQEVRTELRQRQLLSPSTQRAVSNMLLGTLFRRAPVKHHKAAPAKNVKLNYGNLAQLEKQSNAISEKVSLAGNEYHAVQKALAGIHGASRNSLAQKGAKIQALFSNLQDLYHRQSLALHVGQDSYRGTETKGNNIWARSSNEFQVLPHRFNALSRRAPAKHHTASPAKSIKISSSSLAQLDKQSLAVGAKVDEAWREQKAFRKALAGAGWAGTARTAMDHLGSQIDAAFNQLHSLLHQSSAPTNYRAVESKEKGLWE